MNLETKIQVKIPVICLLSSWSLVYIFIALKEYFHDSVAAFGGRVSFLSVFYLKI